MKIQVLTGIMTSVVAGCLFLVGCEGKSSSKSAMGNVSLQEMYKDSVLLEINGNLYEPEIIWGNVAVYLRAWKRMYRHSWVEQNQIVTDVRAAEDIRISQNIFDYIMEGNNSMNEVARRSGGKIIQDGEGYIWAEESKEVVAKEYRRRMDSLRRESIQRFSQGQEERDTSTVNSID